MSAAIYPFPSDPNSSSSKKSGGGGMLLLAIVAARLLASPIKSACTSIYRWFKPETAAQKLGRAAGALAGLFAKALAGVFLCVAWLADTVGNNVMGAAAGVGAMVLFIGLWIIGGFMAGVAGLVAGAALVLAAFVAAGADRAEKAKKEKKRAKEIKKAEQKVKDLKSKK